MGNQKIDVTDFIAIFALLWWSRSAVSQRSACIHIYMWYSLTYIICILHICVCVLLWVGWEVASWRSWKAGGVIAVWVWRPENQGSWWYKFQSKGRRRQVSQLMQSGRERENSVFLCLFVLFSPSVDWLMPTHTWEGNLFYLVHQLKH